MGACVCVSMWVDVCVCVYVRVWMCVSVCVCTCLDGLNPNPKKITGNTGVWMGGSAS